MVALRSTTKKAQSQIVREQNIRAMVDRVVDRGAFWLVPSSQCQDAAPTKKNVNAWYTVDLSINYCECQGGRGACMHKEAARRRYEAEQQFYRNYEMGL